MTEQRKTAPTPTRRSQVAALVARWRTAIGHEQRSPLHLHDEQRLATALRAAEQRRSGIERAAARFADVPVVKRRAVTVGEVRLSGAAGRRIAADRAQRKTAHHAEAAGRREARRDRREARRLARQAVRRTWSS